VNPLELFITGPTVLLVMSASLVQPRFEPKVPAEFIGKARDFLRRVDADGKVCDAIRARSVRRCERLFVSRPGRTYRPEHLIELENLWRSMPPFGAIIPLQVEKTKRGMRLSVIRMMAATTRLESWQGEQESDLMAVQLGLDVQTKFVNGVPPNAKHFGGPIVGMSLHALARRFQRGFGLTTDQAIQLDLLSLLVYFKRNKIAMEHLDSSFTVPVAGVGEWRGVIRGYKEQDVDKSFVIMDVRTFV
jgi:hypothetical protein